MKATALAALTIAAMASTPAIAGDSQNAANDDAVNANTGRLITFDLIRSAAIAKFANLTPNAHGRVVIHAAGEAETMQVTVTGLPPLTRFALFITQVPNPPFGLSWFVGNMQTNQSGQAFAEFVGRFSRQSFIVSPGVAAAPPDPFMGVANSIPDATQNPTIGAIQIYHLGLWFDSPQDVVKAGGPGTVTAFNGDHNAGVQVLNTGEFPDTAGPLFFLNSPGNLP